MKMGPATRSADDFRTNWWTLSFSRAIEADYQEDQFHRSIHQIRTALLLGILFYGLFGILDFILFPETIVTFLIIRYAIVIPYTLAVYLFSYSKRFMQFANAASASVVLLSGLGITVMMMTVHSSGSAIYYVGLILVIIFGYTIFKIRFVWATLAGWTIVFAYEITALWLTDTPISTVITNNFFFLAGNLIGMFANYSIESMTRKNYIQTYLLETEKGKVDTLNTELESRVEQRTQQLFQSNQDLRQEMGERREAEEKFRSLFERSKDAVYITTPEGKFVDMNPAGVEMLGYNSIDELLTVNIARDIYVNPDDRQRFEDLMVKQGHVKDLESMCRRQDGKEIVVIETATAVRNKDGNVTYFQGIMKDVTEKKVLERQLIQSQKLESLGTLAGGIAHDLNNVLTPIILSIDLLQDKLEGKRTLQLLKTIESNASRGAEIVKQVLTFARRTEAEFTSLQVGELLDEMKNLIEHTFPKDIRVDVKIADKLPAIEGNSTQLHQVLLNLCVNARDAMPDGGLITIQAESMTIALPRTTSGKKIEPGPYIHLSVTDEGIGMPPHVIGRIFEPFFTTKEVGKGTGLGLSVLHSIVESHGGIVEVVSEVDQGSIFSLYLPASAVTADGVEEAKESSSPRGQRELLLVADDEESIRILIKEILESFNYRVLTAGNGLEAMELFKENQPEIKCILTDMLMPDLDGPNTIRAIREINASIPIIAISGLISDGDSLDSSVGQAIQASLSKPFSARELLETIQSVLPGAAKAEQLE